MNFSFSAAPGGGYTDTTDNDLTGVDLNILDLSGVGANSTPPGPTTLNITGNALNFTADPNTNATPVVNLNANGSLLTFNVSAPLNLSSKLTFTGSGSANFIFSGPITANDNSIVVSSGRSLTFSGPIALGRGNLNIQGTAVTVSNVVSGGTSSSISISGLAKLVLSGNNTLSGNIFLNGGELDLNNPSPTATASPVGTGTLNFNGASLDQLSPGTVVLATNNPQRWSKVTFIGTNPLNLGTGPVTIGGTVTATISNFPLTVGGPIGDSGTGSSLTKSGHGMLVLGGTNSYTGGTAITDGTLQFNSPSAIAGSGRNVTVNSVATGGAAAAGYAVDQAFLNRINTSSAGTIALGADSSNNLDFSAAGANLSGMSLGADGNYTYSGTLTPFGTTYLLGGGSTQRVAGTLMFNGALTDVVSGTPYGVQIVHGINGLSAFQTAFNAGAVILARNNTYSGTTSISADAALQVGNGGTAGSLGTSSAPINDGGVLIIDRSDSYQIANNINSTGDFQPGSFIQAGNGQTTLTGNNTYTGNTVLMAGTLVLGGASALPTTTPIVFNGTATLNLAGANVTASGVHLGTNSSGFAGTVTGGSLNLTGSDGLTLEAYNTSGTTAALDLGALTKFTESAPNNSIYVGNNALITATPAPIVDLKLSAISNAITVAGFVIGEYGSVANTVASLSSVHLGAAGIVDVGALTIGNQNAGGALDFQSGLTSPSLILRGVNGANSATGTVWVDVNQMNAGAPSTGTLDLSAGGVDAIVTNLNVAAYIPAQAGTLGATGTVKIGTGTLYAGNLTLGMGTLAANGGTPAPIQATFTQNAGSVLAGNLVLGSESDSSIPLFTSTYNLGTASSAATILAHVIKIGTGTFDPASRETINWLNGTIENYDPAGFSLTSGTGGTLTPTDLSISGATGGGVGMSPAATLTISMTAAGTHTFVAEAGHTITVNNTVVLSGSGTLTKSGAGVLNLLGQNTYAGGTFVTAGTLLVNSPDTANGTLGSGGVVVGDGSGKQAFVATLAGSGVVVAPVSVSAGSSVSSGDGSSTTGTLTFAAAAGNSLADGSKYLWKINDPGKSLDGTGTGAGAAGSAAGWDELVFSSLNVGAGAGVDVVVTGIGSGGTVANFDPSKTYRWPIAVVPGNGLAIAPNFHPDAQSIASFDAANAAPSASTLWISGDANDVFINYSPTPEPTSLALLGFGGGLTLLRRRRLNREIRSSGRAGRRCP